MNCNFISKQCCWDNLHLKGGWMYFLYGTNGSRTKTGRRCKGLFSDISTFTCWTKHLSPSESYGPTDNRLCFHRWNPLSSGCAWEFSRDTFLQVRTPCLDELSAPHGESVHGCGENQSSPLLLPWIPAEQTNRPKQYDIYHISITLNAPVSILHCPRQDRKSVG